MVFLIGFILFCMTWLTVLTYRNRRQSHQNEELNLARHEDAFKIQKMTNKIEYLTMLLYGKKENKDDPETDQKGDGDYNDQ
jgi:hypothetical protein